MKPCLPFKTRRFAMVIIALIGLSIVLLNYIDEERLSSNQTEYTAKNSILKVFEDIKEGLRGISEKINEAAY